MHEFVTEYRESEAEEAEEAEADGTRAGGCGMSSAHNKQHRPHHT
jgi:hypothetical protein